MESKKCKGCGETVESYMTGKYCDACQTKPVYDGYAKWQLREAFDMVACKLNWKNPIVKLLPGYPMHEETKRLITSAVVFYAGCRPTFTQQGDKTLVRAAGYYEAVGA